MNVGSYCAVDAWNPVTIGPDFINIETFTLMFHPSVVISYNHLRDVMIFGDDCRVPRRVSSECNGL